MLGTTWAAGQPGHPAEHNRIGTRLNASIFAIDYGVSPAASAATNSAGITAAIAAATALGGGCVRFPSGILLVDAPIVLPIKVTLAGEGIYATQFRATTTYESMISLTSVYGCGVTDLWLETMRLVQYGIKVTASSYSNLFHRLLIGDAVAAGVYFDLLGVAANTISSSIIAGCGRGIECARAANVLRVVNCSISRNLGAGLYAYRSSNINMRGCTIEQNGLGGTEQIGLYFDELYAQTIVGCYFEANGLEVGGAGVDLYLRGADGTVVMSCYFNGLDTRGEHAIVADNCAIIVLGGQSNRHTGAALVEVNGGTINNIGFVAIDPAALTR